MKRNNILLLDNYDSFTYNLLHILRQLGCDAEVFRNDRITVEEAGRFDKILLSPGPGIPSEAGILMPLIRRYAAEKSILGVCLGEQAIAEVFGARLENLSRVYHGVESQIAITADDPIFKGLGNEITAGRYHSWVVSKEGFPYDELEITAEDKEEGMIMGIRHRRYNVHGIQFHPESLMTPSGSRIIENWLEC